MNWKPPAKVLIQGNGLTQLQEMITYSEAIAAIVNPGEGGQNRDGLPVFDLVEEAIAVVGSIDTSVIAVEPYAVLDAASEAIAAGIQQIIIITGGVPPLDLVYLRKKALTTDTIILGPASRGILLPGQIWLGPLNPTFYSTGQLSILTDSEHLAAEVAFYLSQVNLGTQMVIHLGSEKLLGSNIEQWLLNLENHPESKGIVFIIRVDRLNLTLVDCFTKTMTKPVILYSYGLRSKTTPNDAKTIISKQLSYSLPHLTTFEEILATLRQSSVLVADSLLELPEILKVKIRI